MKWEWHVNSNITAALKVLSVPEPIWRSWNQRKKTRRTQIPKPKTQWAKASQLIEKATKHQKPSKQKASQLTPKSSKTFNLLLQSLSANQIFPFLIKAEPLKDPSFCLKKQRNKRLNKTPIEKRRENQSDSLKQLKIRVEHKKRE